MSDSTKKFFFDNNDFSEEAQRLKREAAKKPTFSAEQMEASKKAGFDEGRKIGIDETLNSQEAQIRDTLQQVVMGIARLESEETKRLATFIEQSMQVTAQALSRALPALLDILSIEQISIFAKQVLSEQAKGQTIQIHIAPKHFEEIGKRLTAMQEKLKRKQNCVVIADPSISGLECRFEWTGGGAEWNPGMVADKLLALIIINMPEELRATTALPAPQGMDETPETPHNKEISTGDVP